MAYLAPAMSFTGFALTILLVVPGIALVTAVRRIADAQLLSATALEDISRVPYHFADRSNR